MTAEEVAASLTKAQRKYLGAYARFTKRTPYEEPRWMTFPPSNTHAVLVRLGLTDKSGGIQPFGLAVRAVLVGDGV